MCKDTRMVWYAVRLAWIDSLESYVLLTGGICCVQAGTATPFLFVDLINSQSPVMVFVAVAGIFYICFDRNPSGFAARGVVRFWYVRKVVAYEANSR